MITKDIKDIITSQSLPKEKNKLPIPNILYNTFPKKIINANAEIKNMNVLVSIKIVG
mgnify:CR=1 FL=1